jgi:hypothetical protein
MIKPILKDFLLDLTGDHQVDLPLLTKIYKSLGISHRRLVSQLVEVGLLKRTPGTRNRASWMS